MIIFDNFDHWDINWDNFSLFWQLRRHCEIWDIGYNSDNWEPEFMIIFVIWQSIVTLDSIRNSCNVFLIAPLANGFVSTDMQWGGIDWDAGPCGVDQQNGATPAGGVAECP